MARRTATRRERDESAPGWIWMLSGFGLGLAVALGVYLGGRTPAPPARPAPATEAVAARAPEPARAQARAPAPEKSAPAPQAADERRFDFYDLLPSFEVVVPETDVEARVDTKARDVEEPGSYVLQAGSFTSLADADRRQASLALLGIESHIQRVTIGDDEYHRVRIGPVSDLERLNELRRRLRDARVETMLMQARD